MRGTCPMAKIGQHFVGMLWTQKEHISGARRYVQHARPGGHIEERPLAVAQAEPTSGVARKPGTPPPRARLELRLARQIDDSRPAVGSASKVRSTRPASRVPRSSATRLRCASASAEYSGAGTDGTSCSSAYSFTPTTRLSPDSIARWASYALRAIAS